ncbi:microcin ABC transporter ATP-binding protein [Paucibacter sp. KBW04]|uniref:dipeptide ABC transporter ATP-binding protein n=1 Tax=Paucibacter sp. KBW04 TaxID=2153361 RepID=UPI000F55A09C|nr:ABC transporter ATP-binding protein [Paucibacter sp. KBW04]RQO62493.1 microcin ABC transporter ATP-binding protein [Paucibacter sp. KBW04]
MSLTVNAPLLDIRGLRLAIAGQPLVQDLSLQLQAGEILGLVGESGSGKSLTALALMGLAPPQSEIEGQVLLAGQDLLALDELQMNARRGSEIAMVFQEPMTALNPLMRIGDQVAEVLRLPRAGRPGLGRRAALARAAELLDQVGLPESRIGMARLPHELSGGQRQRVAIAMALALSPKLLIADEPTTALDVVTQAQILALLRERVRAQDCALILISHDLAVVAELADRVAVMQGGRLLEQGDTLQMLSQPREQGSRHLLAHSRLSPRLAAQQQPEAAEESFSQAPPLLELRDLRRSFFARSGMLWRAQEAQTRAVDGVSLQIRRGERLGLVGASGCGKSTLLRCVLGLDKPQGGEVLLQGQRFWGGMDASQRELRRLVQIVFQDPYGSFDPRWRVWQLVAEPLHLLGEDADSARLRQRVGDLLELVGLAAEDMDRYAHQFSGGQRQRIAIARALIVQPQLLVLDEAVSALDVSLRAQILALLDRLSQELGLALLFVSHDLAVVRAVTDVLHVMDAGRIVESGATEALFSRPQHPVTQALLAATPDLDRALSLRHSKLAR